MRYKEEYGDYWLKMYELSQENKLHLADMNHGNISISKRYNPKSQASENFLKEFR